MDYVHLTFIVLKRGFVFSLILLCIACVCPVGAVNMTSDEYRIQFGTVNSGGKKMTDSSYKLSTSVGQAAAQEFQSNGYIVKAGFQYIYSRIPFTFSLSNTRVDFATLVPGVPALDSLTLRVSFGGAGQYIVTTRADHPLATSSFNTFIPFTSCNGGGDTCSTTLAKPWTLTSAYGFGYSMSGQDIPLDFIDTTYYRPFANMLTAEPAVVVMQNTNVTDIISPTPNPASTPAPALTGIPHDTEHESTMTLKTTVSAIQTAGSYSTVVRFLATPSF